MKYFVFNEFENIYTDDFQEAKDWYNSHIGARIFETEQEYNEALHDFLTGY